MSVPACPQNGEALAIRDAEGHVGHCCATCRGVWLPKPFLASIGLERKFVAERFAALLAEQPPLPSGLPCPAACGVMQWGEIKGIELEWCPACGGVWFDRGEVGRLLKHYPPRHAARGDSGADAGDWVDLADLVGGGFDLFS